MLGVPGCVHDGWLYLTKFRDVDKHFLYYFFYWKKQHFYNSAYGAAIQNINTEILRNTDIALPPLPVQERIASILSAYDDLIAKNTRRIKILEEMAEMIFREWFVSFRFPGHAKVPMVKSELGLIPKGWEVRKLFDVAEVTYGFPFKSKLFTVEPIGIGTRLRLHLPDNVFPRPGAKPLAAQGIRASGSEPGTRTKLGPPDRWS
jgi:type I restriction enzyme S subunit